MKPLEREKLLVSLTQEPDTLKKRLIALGLITDALAPDNIVPVLVGGTAMEFYTAGDYATRDVDPALSTTAKVERVFAELTVTDPNEEA